MGTEMGEGDAQGSDPAGDGRACRRIEALVDAGSFLAAGERSAAGAAGFARIDGLRVGVHADGGLQLGGRTTAGAARRLAGLLGAAGRSGTPLILLLEGSGPRIDEGLGGLAAWTEVLAATARLDRRCLVLAVLLGPVNGAGALLPGLADVVVSIPGGSVCRLDEGCPATGRGPDSRGTERPEGPTSPAGDLTIESGRSAAAGLELVAHDEAHAFALLRSLLVLLARRTPPGPDPDMPSPGAWSALGATAIPLDPNTPWDVRSLVRDLVDDAAFLVFGDGSDPLLCALGRIGGRTTGILANRSDRQAGVPDDVHLRRAARFVGLCDKLTLPVISLIDTPALAGGTLRDGAASVTGAAELVAALARAQVPRLTVVLRKGFGAALLAMAGLPALADKVLALPGAQLAATLPDLALEWLHGREIAGADDPLARRDALAEAYQLRESAAEEAAERGLVDVVVPLADLRQALLDGLATLHSPRLSGRES